MKAVEKRLLKAINQGSGINYPIKVDIALSAHKRSLILQAELGGVEFPPDEQFFKYKRQYNQEKILLFSHIHRIIACVVDCQVALQDAVGARNALELARSFSARVWDNSPYQLKQLTQIGLVAIRKLAIGGITSLESLEAAEPHQIDMLLSKNPPFGQNLLRRLGDFPKLRVSVKMVAKECHKERPVVIKFEVQCGFMNEKAPTTYNKKPLYVCLLTERSDGYLIDVTRISGTQLGYGKDVLLSAELWSHTQNITCYVMCEAIAGTLRYAELRHDLPSHMFPPSPKMIEIQQPLKSSTSPETLTDDEIADEGIADQDMVAAAAGVDFSRIEDFEKQSSETHQSSGAPNLETMPPNPTFRDLTRLENGKWACNHKCKDKSSCKHMCCREGIEKPPKPPRKASMARSAPQSSSLSHISQTTSNKPGTSVNIRPLGKLPRQSSALVETLDLTQPKSIVGDGGWSSQASKSHLPSQKKGLKQSSILSSIETSQRKYIVRNPGLDHVDIDWAKRVSPPSAPWTSEGFNTDQPYDVDAVHVQNCLNHDLPSPSTILCQDYATGSKGFELESLDEFDLEQFDELEKASDNDVEAAMVEFGMPKGADEALPTGLSSALIDKSNLRPQQTETDARLKPDDDRKFASNTVKGANRDYHGLPSKRKEVAERQEKAANMTIDPACRVSSDLFLSMDSPEKRHPPGTQTMAVSNVQNGEMDTMAPMAKRHKLSDNTHNDLQQDSATGSAQTRPAIKAGHPAWVYDLDPDFVAEYQDFVEFV